MKEIAVSEAQVIDQDYEVGLECYEQLSLEDFGRRAVMAARQTLVSRIMELEKEDVFKKYSDREGELVIGEVNQVLKRELLILDDATGSELLLPRTEMIKADHYRKGDIVRSVIRKVELRNGNPVIMLSRTDPSFLQRLMEQEVPEIEDGLIVIKKIVRLPGERAKVAVESFDDRIDPVGARPDFTDHAADGGAGFVIGAELRSGELIHSHAEQMGGRHPAHHEQGHRERDHELRDGEPGGTWRPRRMSRERVDGKNLHWSGAR